MIPEGWRKVAVQDIAKVLRGASPRPKSDPRYYGGNVPRLMVSDVTRDGKYVTPRTDFLTEAGAKLSRPMPKGTLVIVCSGTVGVPTILNVDCCIHDGFLALYGISKDCDVDYLYEIFSFMQANFDASATHGGIFTNLTTEIVREFEFFLPPLKEQQKIAEILSTWDRAIELLEQLIAMKRKLKQGLMQQLLTGKRRFKEFGESEWETVSLRKIITINYGKSPKEVIVENGKFPIYGTGGITGYTNHFLHNGESIIVGRKGTIDKVRYISSEFWAIDTTYYLTSPESVNLRWLYYFLSYIGLAQFNEASGIPSLNRDTLYSIKLNLPAIEEQQKIASVLSSTDVEISTLEKQLSAYKQQKRGLMQQLLTGKKRVASPPSTVFDSGRPLSNFVERGENLA